MPPMHRRLRRIPRDMHYDARELVVAPVLLWCQNLREPNATPVVALVIWVRPERPLHSDEEHGRQPIPERVLGCPATASILCTPFCFAEMRMSRTRAIHVLDAPDLTPEQLLHVDLVLQRSAHILHVHPKHVLDLTDVICNELARLANCPVAHEDPEDVLLHSRAFTKGRQPAPTESFRCTEGLDSVSEKRRRITLAPPELLSREEALSRGDCQPSLFVWPDVLRGEGGSLVGESAHGTAVRHVRSVRTASLHVRVDDPPNRLHPKEHLRDRIHEARVAQVGNAPSTAAPLQLTQHVLAGNSVGVRAQVPARRQRPQQLRHAARVASGQHGSHLGPPVSRSPRRASATPSTAPATRRTTCGRRRICDAPVLSPARPRPLPRPAGPASGAMNAAGTFSASPGPSACEDSGVRTADAAAGAPSAAAAPAASSTPACSPSPAELPAERDGPSGNARGTVGGAGAELDSGAAPSPR